MMKATLRHEGASAAMGEQTSAIPSAAWRAGASLFDLFGDKPVAIAQTVGPKAPNRRPTVAKVETYLDRTGQYDLIRTDGPTGYYGSRLDQGIRLFQTANALKVDGLIKP